MCLLATAGHCTCHYFRDTVTVLRSCCEVAHSPRFLPCLLFSMFFLLHNQRGIICLPEKRGSPLILDWLDWAWRPKGSNPHPLKTRDANSNHNIANICFALPKCWFGTCLEHSSLAAAFSTAPAAKDHSFLWHVLWVLAHRLYIYRDRVMTHVHGLLVPSYVLSSASCHCWMFL